MINIPEVGDVVNVKSFGFTNKQGGTGLSDWQHDERFVEVARVEITKAWHDYECGWRYWAKPLSPELIEYMKRNSSTPDKLYVSQFDVVRS